MKQVTVEKISEQTDISSGETALGLVLVRESGEAFFLPVRLEEEEFNALLHFLLVEPREVMHEPASNGEVPFEAGGYEPDEYSEPPPVVKSPEYSPQYSLEGDDFEGGGGINQL